MIAYLIACIAMGLGVAMDVAIATLVQSRIASDPVAGGRWIRRITLTHTLFPMVGYYSFIAFSAQGGAVLVAAHLIATVLIFALVASIYAQVGHGSSEEPSGEGAAWVLVLAVSWDALLSGPAKAAQAASWSAWEVAASFPIAGLVVFMVAFFSLHFSRAIRGEVGLCAGPPAIIIARLIELAVFKYFGFLSLLSAFPAAKDPELVATGMAIGWTAAGYISLRSSFAASATALLRPNMGETLDEGA